MSLNKDHLLRCLYTLEQAMDLLLRSEKDSIEYEVFRNATVKGFELTLETAGKLLRKTLKNFFTLPKEVDETTTETINGQSVQVTRKVKKDVSVKMAIKQPTRRELKAAELFYGKEFNRFFSMGFMPRSILVNRHLDLAGGVLSEKERNHIAELVKKSADLEADLARLATAMSNDSTKREVEAKLTTIRTEIVNLQVANESVFSQTADARAQSQLNTWFALFLILVDHNGKWAQYFEGDTFEQKEEFMWALEEKVDELYNKAVPGISKFINIFISGGDTVEKFKQALDWLDKETQKQLESIKIEDEIRKVAEQKEKEAEKSRLVEKPVEEVEKAVAEISSILEPDGKNFDKSNKDLFIMSAGREFVEKPVENPLTV